MVRFITLCTVYSRKKIKIHMTEAKLKAEFYKELSAPDMELLWEQLKEEGYVDEVCRGPMEWSEFKEVADRWAEYQRRLEGRVKPPGRSSARTRRDDFVEIELTELEKEHAAALAPYLTRRAALLPQVRGFREEKLGGGTLDPEQVPTYLRRELSHLPSQEYEDLEWALEQAPLYLDDFEMEELEDLVGDFRIEARRL